MVLTQARMTGAVSFARHPAHLYNDTRLPRDRITQNEVPVFAAHNNHETAGET